MEPNDLNIPPSEEPFGRKLSRVASQILIPFLLPLSSVFIGWLSQRRNSAELTQLQKEKQQVSDLKAELDVQTKQCEITAENPGVTKIKRRQLLEEAILKEEEAITQAILKDLERLRPSLHYRQDIYCSSFTPRSQRMKVEAELKKWAYSNPYEKDLELSAGITDILQNDKTCGPETNGCLMWVYLQFWKKQTELLKYKRVAERMKGVDDSLLSE